MRYHILAAAVLFVFLLFLFNSATRNPEQEPGAAELNLAQDYDYFMASVDSTHFNLDGEPRYRIQAKRITHFPDPDYTVIDTPNFVIYQGQEPPWFITSRKGTMDTDPLLNQEKVELSDNVVVHRVDSSGREVDIYTEFLTVYPDSSNLSTDRDVRIESAGGRISSTGMTADLAANRIKLLANVRGSYE